PPGPTLFPYTTLFRSRAGELEPELGRSAVERVVGVAADVPAGEAGVAQPDAVGRGAELERVDHAHRGADRGRGGSGGEHGEEPRSEEHTSELQSRVDL